MRCIFGTGLRPPHLKKVNELDITLNFIWWWDSSSGYLRSVEYLFIAITTFSTLSRSISTCFYTYKQFYFKQFSLSTQFSSVSPIDRTQSGATTPSQIGPGSDCNKGVLCIPSIIGASPSVCLVSYTGHLLGKFYPSTEMQPVYSAAPADWASLVEEILPL